MKALFIPRPTTVPSPSDLMGYLRQCGFQLSRAGDAWHVFSKESQGERLDLDVPQRYAARDYPRAMQMLLEDLEMLERRPAAEILRDVLSSTVDLVRLGLKGESTEDGRVSLESELGLRAATRELVLSAACAAVAPRPVYGSRKYEQAMNHLKLARFGASELGSYVITVETPVPPKLQGALATEEDADPPFERRVGLTLAKAVTAAHEAATESAATNTLDPFTRRVDQGLSANLCDALATLLECVHARALSVGFSFASSRPAPRVVPRKAELTADLGPILRSVASELRVKASWADFELEGPILTLESNDPNRGGLITVLPILDGRHRKVNIRLEGPDYQEALKAHAGGKLVRCSGELFREGRALVLRNPRWLLPVADDES